MIATACDGNEVGIRRSTDALTLGSSTPCHNGTVGSEGNAMTTTAHDGDESGIRWSVVALTGATYAPSDHGAIGSEGDAVKEPA